MSYLILSVDDDPSHGVVPVRRDDDRSVVIKAAPAGRLYMVAARNPYVLPAVIVGAVLYLGLSAFTDLELWHRVAVLIGVAIVLPQVLILIRPVGQEHESETVADAEPETDVEGEPDAEDEPDADDANAEGESDVKDPTNADDAETDPTR